MTAFILLLLLGGMVFVAHQVFHLRQQLSADRHASSATLAKVAQQEAAIRGLLSELAGTLGAIPHAANALAAPKSFSLLEQSLAGVRDEIARSRTAMESVSAQVRDDLATATQMYGDTVEVLNTRGDTFIKDVAVATTLLVQAAERLRETTEASRELHQALRSNAVNFDMVQELIAAMSQTIPQYRDTAQGFSRLLAMAEERNLFSAQTFSRFEESVARLSRSAQDFSAVARTLSASFDASLVQIEVSEEDLVTEKTTT
jgi:hypothetical protein